MGSIPSVDAASLTKSPRFTRVNPSLTASLDTVDFPAPGMPVMHTISFSGVLTPVIVGFFGEDIKAGFNGVAYALKGRAEKAYHDDRSTSSSVC